MFFVLSTDFVPQRFQLPSLNPINASHSFLSWHCWLFLIWLVDIAQLSSFFAIVTCVFGASMGLYAGSRGAFLGCCFIF